MFELPFAAHLGVVRTIAPKISPAREARSALRRANHDSYALASGAHPEARSRKRCTDVAALP